MSHAETARDIYEVARRAQISMLAAGLAYFGFVSLLPMALLAVVVFTVIADEALAQRLLETAASLLGEEIGDAAVRTVFTEERRVTSSLVGLAVLLWSVQRLFRGTDRAFATVYAEHDEKSVLASVRDALLVFATNLLALLLLGLIAVVFGLADGVTATLAPVALFVVLVAIFLPMFYVFPMADVTVTEVLPGTVFAAGAWAVASVGFGVYAATVGTRVYGAAAAAILVLTWLYLGGLALLFGATLNAVLAGHVEPDDVRTTPL